MSLYETRVVVDGKTLGPFMLRLHDFSETWPRTLIRMAAREVGVDLPDEFEYVCGSSWVRVFVGEKRVLAVSIRPVLFWDGDHWNSDDSGNGVEK